jgi:subtilisin family serine protease
MNNPIKTTVFSATVTLSLGLSFSVQAQTVSQIFDGLFETSDQVVKVDSWDAYYKDLKKRVVDLKKQEKVVSLFNSELQLNPSKANEIIKVFLGKHPEFSEVLVGAFISASHSITFPGVQSLPVEISKEVVSKLKPVKTLVVINIREIFSARLANLIDKYPQFSAQLLTYASELNVIKQQSIAKSNSVNMAKNQIDLLKTEEASSYDMAIGGALALAAMAGGGGGGGGSSSSTTCGGGPCAPISGADSYKTTEFNAQAGLAMVKAETLYSYGGSGSDIKVAVFDTGVLASHADLSGRILSSDGFDLETGLSGVSTDGHGHGTHVSGIIAANKDDSGMHGVAYNAKIIPYKIFNAAGAYQGSDSKIADVFSRATAKGSRIFNNSWGSATTIKAATNKTTSANSSSTTKNTQENSYPLTLSQTQSSIDAGVVFVWAAGNDAFTEVSARAGLPYYFPDMKKGYLSVVALDTDGTESSYTNRCGVSADWCISAPGTSIYSTKNDGNYVAMSGTSMAAPMVSGSLAGLKSRFPSLSYHQVRDRLLVTANSTGIYADATIFGHGLMDLSAASSPVGVTMITTTTSDNGAVIASNSSIATLSSEVFAVFADQIANSKIMLVDSFDRANFYTDASAFVKSEKRAFNVDLESLFDQKNTYNKKGVSYYKSKNGQIGLSGVVGLNSDSPTMYWFAGDNDEKALNKVLGLSDSINVASNTSTGLSLQIMPEGKLGVWTNISSETTDDGLIPLAIQNSITLASLDTGLSLTKDFSINNNSLITTGMAYGKPDALSNSLSASGAFKVEAKDALVSFASIGSTLGRASFNLTAQNTQINSVNDLSLFKVPEKISLNDINAKISFESSDQKSQISLSLGQTKTQGNSVSTLSIPVSVDESGSVSYLDMSTPTGALFDHTRASLSFKTKVNKDLDLVGVASSYNPTLNKSANEQVIGVASRWKF